MKNANNKICSIVVYVLTSGIVWSIGEGSVRKSQIERKQSISLLHIDFFSGDNGSSLWHVPKIVAITNTKQNRNNFNIGRNEMLVQQMNLQNIYMVFSELFFPDAKLQIFNFSRIVKSSFSTIYQNIHPFKCNKTSVVWPHWITFKTAMKII